MIDEFQTDNDGKPIAILAHNRDCIEVHPIPVKMQTALRTETYREFIAHLDLHVHDAC